MRLTVNGRQSSGGTRASRPTSDRKAADKRANSMAIRRGGSCIRPQSWRCTVETAGVRFRVLGWITVFFRPIKIRKKSQEDL